MKLIFSTSYDTPVYKNTLESNLKYVGPLALLNLLERELGLYNINSSQETRISLYRKCILLVDDENSFYKNVFNKDELNVSKILLKYRDELIFSGWDFKETNQPERLKNLALIEDVFIKKNGFNGIGDRWQKVLLELTEEKIKEFNLSIIVHDKIEFLHPTFQKLFKKLNSIVQNDELALIENLKIQNNLSKIKNLTYKSITHKNESTEKILLENLPKDNSLVILEFNNNQELCDLMAHYASTEEHIFINEDNSNFDYSLVSLDKNAAGSFQIDANPQIIQLYKLIIPCFSNELNIETLLSLLQLPDSPIPFNLSYKLIKALREKPGVGNETWNKIINEFLEQESCAKIVTPESIMELFNVNPNSLIDDSSEDDKIDIEKIENLKDISNSKLIIDLFLTFDNKDETKSIKKAIKIFEHIIKWAKNELEEVFFMPEIYEQYNYLIDLCENTIIEIKDEKKLKNVEKIIQSIYNANKFSIYTKQEHSVEVIPKIENIVTKCSKSVIWLDFYNKEFEKSNQTFLLDEEKDFLKRIDAYYPENNLVNLQLNQLLRGLLNCNHKLILCCVSNDDDIKRHPLHIRMSSFVNNFDNLVKIDVQNFQDLNILENWHFSVENDGVESKTIKIPESFSYLNSDILKQIKPREKESASSIEKFIQYPFDWVMQYIAQFKETEKLKLSEGNLLKGNIAHKVIENIFNKFINKEIFALKITEEFFDEEFNKVVEEEGAIFLQNENRFDLREFRFRFKRSITTLIEIINLNKLTIIACEKKFGEEQECIIEEALGKVTGSIDLLLQDSEKNPIIFDLKWTYSDKKYIEYLENGNAIQLALYTSAIQNKELSKTGYFLLNQNKLITSASFEGSNIQHIPINYSNLDVLTKLKKSLEERWNELKSGKLEMGESLMLKDLDYYEKGQFDNKDKGVFISIPENKKMKKENPYTGFDLFKGTLK